MAITCAAPSQLIGRTLLPVIADLGFINRNTMTCASYFLFAASVAALSATRTFSTYVAAAAFVSISTGSLMTMKHVVAADYFGVEAVAATWAACGALITPLFFCSPSILGGRDDGGEGRHRCYARRYASAVATLAKHFDTNCNLVVERHQFCHRIQSPGESVQEYVTVLFELAAMCSFKSSEESFRDQFIAGVSSHRIRNRLLLERSSLSFDKAVASRVKSSKEPWKSRNLLFLCSQYLRIPAQKTVRVALTAFTAAHSHFRSV
ncbi:hypothetical protein HPB48_022908 [Haemaphysalis longicornis]|uniref:Retrotransposon gag domain-containing protein n=1 Tax=Haemaphysalis longicornis TaxID=44386 RepID=A0A9J6GS43_HAELO|nr:hypothetical protein HPB48_022908 [Haemaphysalis longicornis]